MHFAPKHTYAGSHPNYTCCNSLRRGDGTTSEAPINTTNESVVFTHSYTGGPGGPRQLTAFVANAAGGSQSVTGQLLTYDSRIAAAVTGSMSNAISVTVTVGVPPAGPQPGQAVSINW